MCKYSHKIITHYFKKNHKFLETERKLHNAINYKKIIEKEK